MLAIVGNWLFSEGSGTTAADSSGNGNNGTLTNGPTWITGPTGHGSALNFNGTNQSVNIGNPAVLNFSGAITISAWVYNTTTTMSTDGVRYIVSHGSNNAYVFLRTWGGSYEFGNWNGSADDSVFAPIDPLDLNNWVLLTGVYDTSANTWILYKNGVSIGSQADSTATGAITVNGNWKIGDSTPFTGVFSGGIDDVAIYNTALSATQVAALFPTLSAPTVTLTKNSNTQVTVSWPRLGGSVTAYNVYRTTLMGQEAGPPINATPIANPSSGTVSYIDTTVDLSVPGAAYYYKVVSLDGTILGKVSTEKSLTTALASTEAGTFTKLTNNKAIQEFVLLTDGTVLGQAPGSSATQWYKLTPSSTGSYAAGTWTQVASSSTIRDYMATSVMQSGKVIIAGGEYGPNGAFDSVSSSTVEVYDPVANTWTLVPTAGSPEDGTAFFDSESILLPNGDVLFGAVSPSPGGTAEIYHVATGTWSVTGPYAYGMGSPDELTWVKLPDGSVLMPDYDNTSQRYIPATNQWVQDGTMPAPLNFGGEMGPGFMLPNGNAVFFGSSGNTLIYHPSGTSAPGTWTLGAKIPYGLACSDVPGAIMRDGKIIMAIGPPAASGVPNGLRFVAYDYTTDSFQDVSFNLSGTNRPEIMLCLPNGSILMSDLGTIYQFTPTAGLANAAWAPAITRIVSNTDGSWTLTGTQLNGISSGASMGDDFQMDTNYPIVQLTDGTGHVYYAKTTNWSSTAVQTGSTPQTATFTTPAGLPAGSYSLVVIANGIPSPAVTFNNTPLTITSSTPAANATVTTSPASYVIQFSTAIDSTTLQASDLTVNGKPADGVALSADFKTATFTFNTNPITAPGTQSMAMAIGAVAEQGNAAVQSPAFSATFTLNATNLQVSSTTPSANGVFILPGPFTFDVTFNQPINPASISTSTLNLSGIPGATVSNAIVLAGNTTARFTISGITTEGLLTASIAAGAVTSAAGLGGSAFTASYTTDITTAALTTPAVAQGAAGSLIYSMPTATGYIGTSNDTDTFTLSLNRDQTVTVIVTPTGSMQPSIKVRDPSNVLIGSATATAFGQPAVIEVAASAYASTGTYQIIISSVAGAQVGYTVQALINADVEQEGILSGVSDNTLGTAQYIGDGELLFDNSSTAARLAVSGTADAGTPDYYFFSATAGEVDSVALKALSAGNVAVSLLDSGGNVLASGITGATNLTQAINRYTIASGGFYYLRVTGDAGTPYNLVVTQNAAFDNEPNDSQGTSQPLDGTQGVLGAITATDNDWYSLQLTPQQILSLTTSTPFPGAGQFSNTLAPVLELYNQAGTLLTTGITLADGRNQTLQYDIHTAGTYRIHVTSSAGTQGEYFLSDTITPAPTLSLPAVAQNPAGSLIYSTSSTGYIGSTGDTNIFTLSLNPGQTATVIVTPTGAFQPSITVRDPSNVLLGSATATAIGQPAIIEVAASAYASTGTYQITVSSITGVQAGYTIQVLINADIEQEGILSGITDNTLNTAQYIGDGALLFDNASNVTRLAVTGTADAGTPDYYQFSATAGEVDSVALKALSAGNVSVALLDSGGNVLASGITGATNLTQAINRYTVASDGFYYLRVTGDAGTPYNLVVTQNAAFDNEPNDSLAVSQSLDGTQGVLGAITAADNDWYSLTISPQQLLTLTTSTPFPGAGQFSNTLAPVIELYDPSGTLLTSGTTLADGRNQTLQYNTVTSGVYHVHVTSSAGTQGEYFLSDTVTPAPTLVSLGPVTIDNGTSQRSVVRSITVTFNGTVTVAPSAAFTLTRTSDNLSIPVTASAVAPAGGGNTSVTLTFSGPDLDNGSLPDGQYTLSINGSQILDSFNQPIDAADTNVAGSTGTVSFFRLFGDGNGDGVVNGLDISQTAANWLSAGPAGDVNADGVVNGLDISAIAAHWLANITTPPTTPSTAGSGADTGVTNLSVGSSLAPTAPHTAIAATVVDFKPTNAAIIGPQLLLQTHVNTSAVATARGTGAISSQQAVTQAIDEHFWQVADYDDVGDFSPYAAHAKPKRIFV